MQGRGQLWGGWNDADGTYVGMKVRKKSENRVKYIFFFCGREGSGKRWKMEAEGRDKESEEEVCDFGVGAGA